MNRQAKPCPRLRSVTAQTVIQVGAIHPTVFGDHVGQGMGVTAVAGVTLVVT